MKKSIYLALTVTSLALFACNSKPAESEQQSEEQIEQVAPAAEAPAEAEEAPALETEEPLAEESAETVAEEAPAAEEPAPAEPAAEPEEEETVFMVVESMAVLPCSGAEMAKLLTVDLNQVDPSADKCRVVVTVIVEKDGRVTHPTVKRPIGNEKLEAYAMQYVLDKLPRFEKPGMQRGQPVRTYYSLPVTFKK